MEAKEEIVYAYDTGYLSYRNQGESTPNGLYYQASTVENPSTRHVLSRKVLFETPIGEIIGDNQEGITFETLLDRLCDKFVDKSTNLVSTKRRLKDVIAELFESSVTESALEVSTKMIDDYVKALKNERQLERFEKLSDVFAEFIDIAKTYSEIVIKEKEIPENLKVIKTLKIGGIAGGSKHVVR